MKNILITGVDSELGEALVKAYLENGDNVYAIGKDLPKKINHYPHFFFFPCDLNETFTLRANIKDFVEKHSFDIVILNAEIQGKIQELSNTNLVDAKEVMEVNLWANKELIDALSIYDGHVHVSQIVAISSGTSINGSKGWGAYSISKAALNMLLNVYAKELPDIHFTALNPGVIDTQMVRQIIENVDESVFPSVKQLRESNILTPQEAARILIDTFPKLLAYESGSFLDIKTIN